MLADKISAISTDTVFRRVKDVVDLYYFSKIFGFNKAEILQTLQNNSRSLGDFTNFLHRTDELEHAYGKFRFTGNVEKPPFDEVYLAVKCYIQDILPKNP